MAKNRPGRPGKRVIPSETRLFFEHFAEAFRGDPLLRPFLEHVVAFGPKPMDTNILAIDPSIDCPDAFLFGSQLRKYFHTFIEPAEGNAESCEEKSVATRSKESLNESSNESSNEPSIESSNEPLNEPSIESSIESSIEPSIESSIESSNQSLNDPTHPKEEEEEEEGWLEGVALTQTLLRQFHMSLVNGFKLACEAGPLCSEPLWGVLFILEDFALLPPKDSKDSKDSKNGETGETEEGAESAGVRETRLRVSEARDRIAQLPSGVVMSQTRLLCHQAFQQASARIAEPMYRCILQCSNQHLGKLYSVINQRRGEVENEDIWEGTDIFTITCSLPVTESLGLANHLREQTSGAVNQPQLQFSHWQILDEDPFSKPVTEEEIEEWGEKFGTRNRAKEIIDGIRKRKGMQTDEKIVENAEKQTTMKSK